MDNYTLLSSHESWGPLGFLGIKVFVTGFNKTDYMSEKVGQLYDDFVKAHIELIQGEKL